MTVDQMNISGDFTNYSVSGTLSGFTDSGDMGHFFAILGLQNSANGEEAITFNILTGFPSTGQSIPDHAVPPYLPGDPDRRIHLTSAIVDLTLNAFTFSGVLDGSWTPTLPTDYTVIVGLQNNFNGEEAITFSPNVTIPEPAPVASFGLALIALTFFGRQSGKRARALR